MYLFLSMHCAFINIGKTGEVQELLITLGLSVFATLHVCPLDNSCIYDEDFQASASSWLRARRPPRPSIRILYIE